MFQKHQTTISIWASLRPALIRYAALLEATPSAMVNELLEGAFQQIEADQPNRPIVLLDRLRRLVGKREDTNLSETYGRQMAGIDPLAEGVKADAAQNVARLVPILMEAKRAGLASAEACQRACGVLENALTKDLQALYDSSLMARAAAENYDPGKGEPFVQTPSTMRLYNDAYLILVRDHLAREVVRETPLRFRAALE